MSGRVRGHDNGSNGSRGTSFRVVSNNSSNNGQNGMRHGASGNGPVDGVTGSGGGMSNATAGAGMGMGMGMGYPMAMGMYANPYNPLYWIQTVNFTIMQISQMIQIFGMSTTALGVSLLKVCQVIMSALRAARKSKYMIWLQEKSKKSSLFKWTIIFLSMLVTSTVCGLVKTYIHRFCGCNSTSTGLLKMMDSLGLAHLLPKFPSTPSPMKSSGVGSPSGPKRLSGGATTSDDGSLMPFI
jgi:hypothetical protein